MKEFWLCFIALFVAVDAIGVVPLFVSLTDGLPAQRLRAVIIQSVVTASLVALFFLNLGPGLLRYLNITVSDFMIAGGLLLLAISFSDLLTGEKKQRYPDPESLGAVPLGIPLIAGPAVLTSSVLLANEHGKIIASMAVVGNIFLAGVLFWYAGPITRYFGRTGEKVLSKIASLLLAAIAVMLIRRGIMEAIRLG